MVADEHDIPERPRPDKDLRLFDILLDYLPHQVSREMSQRRSPVFFSLCRAIEIYIDFKLKNKRG